MTWNDYEISGIFDFFKENNDILKLIARSLSKQVINPANNDEALNIVQLHCENSTILLNKRLITKDILLRYLHCRQVSIESEFNKSKLIHKIQKFWIDKFLVNDTQKLNNQLTLKNNLAKENDIIQEENIFENNLLTNRLNEYEASSNAIYPIHILASKFSEWFFTKWNENNLKSTDFWLDCTLQIRIIDQNGSFEDYQSSTNITTVENLIKIRHKFNFCMNPNNSTEGVQGRIDCHGLVMVVSCGTLHIEDKCVGVFESTFGLIRDPSSDNNWKANRMRLLFRSAANTFRLPILEESDTLQEILSLPVPKGSID